MGSDKMEKAKIWDAVPGFELDPEIDIPEMHSWFHVAYSIPPWTPLFGWHWMNYCARGCSMLRPSSVYPPAKDGLSAIWMAVCMPPSTS
jgi:hypothetical protein